MAATPYALQLATPTPTAHSPLLVPASNSPDPDKPPDVGPLPRTLPPLCPSHTPRPDMHIQDKPGVLLSKEKKKWEGGDQRGRLPAYATPQRGAAIAEAVPKHITPKPAAARGALGAGQPAGPLLHGAKHQKMSVVDGSGCRPCLPSFRQSGTFLRRAG